MRLEKHVGIRKFDMFTPPAHETADVMTFTISSPAFEHGGLMPRRYTCDGDDVSPLLEWSAVPEGTKSLALIVDDPDAPDPAAPKRTWVHWVVFNIPALARELPEGVGGDNLPTGALEGRNEWKKVGYGGPCPPIGTHRSFFKLYAIDCTLENIDRPTKGILERAMRGHVLAGAELMGVYKRSK